MNLPSDFEQFVDDVIDVDVFSLIFYHTYFLFRVTFEINYIIVT